jgi:hypothetical protein
MVDLQLLKKEGRLFPLLFKERVRGRIGEAVNGLNGPSGLEKIASVKSGQSVDRK